VQAQRRDGEGIVPLWLTLRRLLRSSLAPKSDAVASAAQLVGRGITLNDRFSQPGASAGGGVCGGFPCPWSGWSWSADDASTAASAPAHNPHVLVALVRAQVWLVPDER
jgi:hypothetical protein